MNQTLTPYQPQLYPGPHSASCPAELVGPLATSAGLCPPLCFLTGPLQMSAFLTSLLNQLGKGRMEVSLGLRHKSSLGNGKARGDGPKAPDVGAAWPGRRQGQQEPRSLLASLGHF